jgi:hypothetical protein
MCRVIFAVLHKRGKGMPKKEIISSGKDTRAELSK